MAQTRRTFMRSAALAIGAAGTPLSAGQQLPPQPFAGSDPPGDASGQAARPSAPPIPASSLQVPRMPFGPAEISRLIVGCNPS